MDDGFNFAAFYVEGQLDFPNQVPGNVLQLYHELHDMEQKVKSLENEIAVYAMSFHKKNHPTMRRGIASVSRKPNNGPKKCCIPGPWNCARPVPVISSETHPRNRTISRPVNLRSANKRNSVSTAVQTTNFENRGSRLSKVSWNSKVDVRYIGSGIRSEKIQKAPLRGAEPLKNVNEELKNVVHLKIKIPKDVLNLTNDEGGHDSKRLENEWNKFNSSEENNDVGKTSILNRNSLAETSEAMSPKHVQTFLNPTSTHICSHNDDNGTEPTRPLTDDNARNVGHGKMEATEQHGNTIAGPSIVKNERKESTHMVGIPVKEPGKSVCDSQGCTCKGSPRNDQNLEKVRHSFDMTESELSLLEEAVHKDNPGPMELKIQTEYGSVNVISHDPECNCKICETFGSRDESDRKPSGRSDSAAVISKKIIRVNYNGHYRNIITHTEECGCDICSNIEEHSYRLMKQRPSIVSTHRGELVVKNKGVCGCKNCKTIEMDPHLLDVDMVLSRTSSRALDQCYYSDATIPSMQSFPREGLMTSDGQGASFSSPPSINSSDLTDDVYGVPPSSSNVNGSDPVVNVHAGPDQTTTELLLDAEPVRETDTGKCIRSEYVSNSRLPKSSPKRFYNLLKTSPKSSPGWLDKNRKVDECLTCKSCKFTKNEKSKHSHDKCKPVPMKSTLHPHDNQSSMPLARISIIDTQEKFHPNLNEVSLNSDQKTGEKTSTYSADHVTLEDLISDLIRGQPGSKKDNVYTVTLGEVSNRGYTKIHIVDCSAKSGGPGRNGTTTDESLKEPKQLSNGDGSNSNVFFVKSLPSSLDVSQIFSSTLPNVGDNRKNNDGTDNRSMSSPACIQGDPKPRQSSHLISLQEEIIVDNKPESIQEVKIDRSCSETIPRSEVPKKAFKLTISFGKKVASFFKQRGKKNTMSNTILSENEVPPNNPKFLKTFTIYETGKQLEHMKLLAIDVKPQHFTSETNARREESHSSPFKQGPILCLVEKNSNTQVVAAVPT